MENHWTQNSENTLEKKNKNKMGGMSLPDSKAFYIAIGIRTMWGQKNSYIFANIVWGKM